MSNETPLNDAIEHSAQWLEERIPQMVTDDYRLELGHKLDDWMRASGYTNARVAALLNVSGPAISQFKNNKYPGDWEKLAKKVTNLLNTEARKERTGSGRPAFVETTVARKVQAIIANTEAYSTDEGKIAIIIGDGGHGKSHCLRAYAEVNPNSVYVELDDCMTMRSVLAEIAGRIGLAQDGSAEQISRRIIDNLVHRSVVVILDEASGLNVSHLNKLRQIICVKSRCPLILSGNHGLLTTVNQETTRRGCESLDQFTSRLMAILNLDDLANQAEPGGGNGLYTEEDLRKLYQYGGVKLSASGVRALRAICATPRSGRLRTCSHIITALHNVGGVVQSGTITAELIAQAIVELGLPVRVRLPLGRGEFTLSEETELTGIAATA